MSDDQLDPEDVYRAALRQAFRDGLVGGEEIEFLQTLATTLGVPEEARDSALDAVKFESRMGQLASLGAPADAFRDVCRVAWGRQLEASELTCLAALAGALSLEPAAAQACLEESAPSGARVPDLASRVPVPEAEPAPESRPAPAREADADPGDGGLGALLVVVGLAGLAAVAYGQGWF